MWVGKRFRLGWREVGIQLYYIDHTYVPLYTPKPDMEATLPMPVNDPISRTMRMPTVNQR